MHRRPTTLLHDYKPSGNSKPKKTKALQWFAVGLGVPLIGLLLISTMSSGPSTPTSSENPSLVASGSAPPLPERLPFEVPELEIVPEFDSIVVTIGRGDTMDGIFRRNDLNLGHLAAIASLEEPRQLFRRLQPGDEFEIVHDHGSIVSLYAVLDLTSALNVTRGDDGYQAEIVERPIEIRTRMAYGVITNSLFESGAEAGLSDRVIMNMAGIFAWDIDFVFDIRQGDNYYVHYEEIWQDGEFVQDGEIIVAEFNNDGDTFHAIRFRDSEGRSDYFNPEGESVRRAFLRNPVDFTRISSNFNPNRRHPVLNTIRAHRGVDYAAPRGTPIVAAGDGRVIFRGVNGGYGNTIILQHGGNITTLYAHMSSFARSAQNGSRVRQGQTIGYVGSTGLATGAHLHYEYRLNGVHRNPRTVPLPQAEPIDAQYRERFLASVGPILEELEAFKQTQLVSTTTYSAP